MRIGFSTGALYKSGLSLDEILRRYLKLGCSAAELNFVRLNDLLATDPATLSKNRKLLSFFSWVSLHAPVKINYGAPDSPTQEIFAKIGEIHKKVARLNLVVFHPETVVDFKPFEDAPFPIAFENMDNRKAICRDAIDIEQILALSEQFHFVLDVNHAYTNDSTMRLAQELYERAGHRLAEIHLSGYNGYHEPLHETRQAKIIAAIRDFNVPIIIESVVSPDTLEQELQYILGTINGLRK